MKEKLKWNDEVQNLKVTKLLYLRLLEVGLTVNLKANYFLTVF